MLASIRSENARYRSLAERALLQIDDEQFFARLDPESNSIAVLVKHLGGNLRSRFTEQLEAVKEPRLRALIRDGIARAKQYQVDKQRDVRRYLECVVQYGADFDTNRRTRWAGRILRTRGESGRAKMDRIGNSKRRTFFQGPD